jgi:hypothetical protein
VNSSGPTKIKFDKPFLDTPIPNSTKIIISEPSNRKRRTHSMEGLPPLTYKVPIAKTLTPEEII